MADIRVQLMLPGGTTQTADVPEDVPVKELIPELITALSLPTTGPDGRPISYELHSKSLARRLNDEETLKSAGIPKDERLSISPTIVPGMI